MERSATRLPDLHGLAEQLVNAYNDRDLDAMPCADDVLVLARLRPDLAGYDNAHAARGHWVRQWTSFPDARVDLLRVVAAGETFVAEVAWTGTNTGPLMADDGRTHPATNRRIDAVAVAICEVSAGRIRRIDHYSSAHPSGAHRFTTKPQRS